MFFMVVKSPGPVEMQPEAERTNSAGRETGKIRQGFSDVHLGFGRLALGIVRHNLSSSGVSL